MNTPAAAYNPYKDISFHNLNNGMVVVLAPNQKAENLNVKVRVKVGKVVENKDNLGVSHLLEHLVFRDSRFNDEQTYLELIKEAGGEVNAYVQRDLTAYYAKIPGAKGEWLVEQFAKMLFDHKTNQDAIKRAKSSVALEIDEPSWLSELMGIDIFAPLFHRYFPEPRFFESEFGISRHPRYSRNEIRLSTHKLIQDQLTEHYASYYRASNMTLFVSGKFDRKRMLSLIEKKYGQYNNRPGKTVPAENPVSNNKPYWRVELKPTGSSTRIYIGTKVLKPTAKDQIVLYVYLDYIAHRLMKELRNKRGETYTAKVYSDEQFGAGYGIVAFETQQEELHKNLNYVQSLIDQEARLGNISDEEIVEAIKLTKEQRYELADIDAESLMTYAEDYYDFRLNYGGTDSPYKVITLLTSEEFKESLPELFSKENAYTYLYVPYAYLKIEFLLILLLSIVFSIIVFQKIFRRKVNETQVRWTQNMTYTPAMFFEVLGIVVLSFLINYLLFTPVDRYITSMDWYHSLTLWPYYVYDVFIGSFIFIGTIMGFLALFPRKLIVEGDTLVMKSMALYLRRFEKSSIKSIRAVSLFKLIVSPKIWLNLRFRYFYNECFWRKGLLLEINDGPIYFLGFKNAKQVVSDLEQHLFKNSYAK